MACGTPVVASKNPGSVDVLGEERCGLLPPDEEFAATVAALLGDETRRAELSAVGLRRASQFTLTRMLESYEKVLFDLTGVYVKSMASV
jgi:glycosyltransferase involved in cell wall biosynthesis